MVAALCSAHLKLVKPRGRNGKSLLPSDKHILTKGTCHFSAIRSLNLRKMDSVTGLIQLVGFDPCIWLLPL